MESSRQDLFIDMVVNRYIFKNNQIKALLLTFIPKTDMGLPETGVNFTVHEWAWLYLGLFCPKFKLLKASYMMRLADCN